VSLLYIYISSDDRQDDPYLKLKERKNYNIIFKCTNILTVRFNIIKIGDQVQ